MQMQGAASETSGAKEVDENGEMPHTLPSSQLTNTTLCRQAADAVPNTVL
jgi:hypothetical protein